MRKIFTLLFALVICATASAQRKIQVDSDERIMGFYTTDELPSGSGVGFSGTPTTSVMNQFGEEVVGPFVGGQIVRFRFALMCDAQVNSAFVYSLVGSTYTKLAEVSIGQTLSEGWHDVELPSPITIEDEVDYCIGFQYVQPSGERPLACDAQLERDVECDYFLYTTTSTWHKGEGYGALCVQAVVRGGNLAEEAVALKDLVVDKYAAQDKGLNYSFSIKNMGTTLPSTYSLRVDIDNVTVATLSTPVALSNVYQTYSSSLDISGLSTGSHTMTITVDDINGNTPTEGESTEVLEASFTEYAGTMPERQMHMVENFTSIYCGNCPVGHYALECLTEDYPGKYSWIAIHSIGMGADTLAVKSGSYLTIESYMSTFDYPSAIVDRAALTMEQLGVENEYCFSLSYEKSAGHSIASAIDNAIETVYADIPAFASINITPEYNADTRLLTITVSGSGSSLAKELLDGCLLTVYLTEDGIEGVQEDYDHGSVYDGWFVHYTHNNVLRDITSSHEWGDDIGWTSDSAYSNTLSTTLASKWNPENMYITAFISGAMEVRSGTSWSYGDKTKALLNNANRVSLIPDPTQTGISTTTIQTDATPIAYFSVDGRQLPSPSRGVNIVKMSDGSTRKMLVK